jgi:2',3'-cyclic-nucleotide 2'-phosphodiesterase (5'-nucleotidase family)
MLNTLTHRPAANIPLKTTAPASGAARGQEKPSPSEDLVTLNILHVNDIHGVLNPRISPEISADDKAGGLANLKTAVDRQRAKNPDGTVVVCTGDFAEGTMESYLSKGEVAIKALKAFGFDLVVPGNHDFAWGQNALQAMLTGLNAPSLGANIVNAMTGEVMEGQKPTAVLNKKGVDLGFIGITTPEMRHYIAEEKLEGLDFRPAAETVKKKYLPELEQQSGLQIGLTHIGFEQDCKLAQDTEGLEQIIGGHSHTVLPEGHQENGVEISQAGSFGLYLGNTEIVYDRAQDRLVSLRSEVIPVENQKFEADQKVAGVMAPYLEKAEKVGSSVKGEALEELHYGHREASKLNQIHADSLLEASGADLCICNSRTLRGHIPAGPTTYRDLYQALPFTEENLVTMKATGKMILDEIEDDLRDKAIELAVPSGLTYEYDPSRPEGSRVVKALTSDGKPLDLEKTYTLACNETMSRKSHFDAAEEKQVLGGVQPLFFQAYENSGPWKNDPDTRVVNLQSR